MKKFQSVKVSSLLTLLLFAAGFAQGGEYVLSNDNTSFPNPDRGWYSYNPLLSADSYTDVGNSGTRLVYAAITLRDFVDKDISSTVLQDIRDRFAELRSSGVKAVLRVNYNEEEKGTDATIDRMGRHMVQLQPLLEDNKDVIAYIEMGYFGQWGEWHDWCGGDVNSDLTDDICSKHEDNLTTWSAITDALLDHVPDDRFIMIRYPGKKQAIFDGEPVNVSQANTALPKARVGHHNDCFLASSDDMGTYQTFGTSTSVTALKNYLSADTEYLPMGGETCYAKSGHRFSCATAIAEMEDLHWTYLNQDYYQGALDIWEAGGCKEEIDKRLGYRLNLRSVTLPDSFARGTSQNISLNIENTGFARVHNPRQVYLRLLQEGSVVAQILLPGVDIRSIGGGQSLILSSAVTIPEDVPEGMVDVALWLPDEDSRNWDNSRFSIRLAYQQSGSDWQQPSSPGHNIFARDVPVVTLEEQETPVLQPPASFQLSDSKL